MTTRREDAIEVARYLAQTKGGEVEDHLEKKFQHNKSGKWSGPYASGERPGGKVVREYVYLDEHHVNYLRVERTEDKQFLQARWDGKVWLYGKPKGPKIPYMLPELIAAAPNVPVFICEGEKDADNVTELGLLASCVSEGAGKWTADLNSWFVGRLTAYILEDNDDPGRRHARLVAKNLTGIVGKVRVVTLPGLAEHGDVSDWLKAGGTKENLIALCAAAETRPIVYVTAGELSAIASAGEKVLLDAGEQLFQRASSLVRPIVEEVDAAHGRKTKIAQFARIDATHLRDRLGRVADWCKTIKKGDVRIDPPLEVALTILARVGEWTFPAIAGVITTPTMRPDGTILDQPGYDAATRLLLIDPPPMHPIPEAPTKDDALAALAALESLLAEFPFADEVARAVALSGLITPVVRGAFPVAPMHATSAPTAGTGKSFLGDVMANIAIGQSMPVMAAGRSEEETEKRLGAALLTGQPLICIDNVNGELGGDALCQIIERPIVEVRILGKSERVRIEARGTTIFCNGNNIILVGDVCRRVITATLDAQMERPELRVFSGNPVETVLTDRGKYISAALTICRAYIVAGRPDKAARLASFEGWSDLVRSALMWLGKADPVASMEMARAEDPELAALQAILVAWVNEIGMGFNHRTALQPVIEMTLQMVPNNAGGMTMPKYPQLFSAVQTICAGQRAPDGRLLGNWLRRFRNRLVGDLKLAQKADPKGGSLWWVEHKDGIETPAGKNKAM